MEKDIYADVMILRNNDDFIELNKQILTGFKEQVEVPLKVMVSAIVERWSNNDGIEQPEIEMTAELVLTDLLFTGNGERDPKKLAKKQCLVERGDSLLVIHAAELTLAELEANIATARTRADAKMKEAEELKRYATERK